MYGVDINNDWVTPHDTNADLTSQYARNQIFNVGDILPLAWYTNRTTTYGVGLAQWNLTDQTPISTGLRIWNTDSSPGNNTYNWTVVVPPGVRLDLSNVFYVELYSNKISLKSSLFNITYKSVTPSSTSSTSLGAPTASTSVSATTSAAASPTAITSSQPIMDTQQQSAATTPALTVGLGVGIGVGVPLLVSVALLICRLRSKMMQSKPVYHSPLHPPHAQYAASPQWVYEVGAEPRPPAEMWAKAPRHELSAMR